MIQFVIQYLRVNIWKTKFFFDHFTVLYIKYMIVLYEYKAKKMNIFYKKKVKKIISSLRICQNCIKYIKIKLIRHLLNKI